MNVKALPTPTGYEGITPYIYVAGAAAAIDFYKKAFGAEELMRLSDPSTGKVGHAELKIGKGVFMLADEFPEMGILGPKSVGGSATALVFYVPDVDAVIERAVEGGAKLLRPVDNQFYGDRSGKIEDPFGHVWNIATHFEDVSIAEMKKRASDLYGMS